MSPKTKLRTWNEAQLVSCLPSIHKAWGECPETVVSMNTYNLSTVGVLERSEVQDCFQLHEEFKASLCYLQPYLKKE